MDNCSRHFNFYDVEWDCYSGKQLKEKHKSVPYKIVGEITKKKNQSKAIAFYNVQGKILYAQPLGTYNNLLYRPYAYIQTSENNYVIVKKSNLAYIALLTLLVFVLIFGLLFKMQSSGPLLDPNAEDYTSSLQRPADWDDSSILIPGYEQLKMQADTNVLSAVLYNPEENPCYFKYSIELKETSEILYQSELIAPGKAVKLMELSKNMKRGTYPVTIKIDTFALDDYEQPLNGGAVEAMIVAIE